MLCETCQSRISAAVGGGKNGIEAGGLYYCTLYDTKDELERGDAVGCYVCRTVWSDFSGPHGRQRLHESLPIRFSIHKLHSAIEADDDDPTNGTPFRITLSPTEHPITQHANRWIGPSLTLVPIPEDVSGVSSLGLNTTAEDPRTSTAESAELWAQWFRTCAESHAQCRNLAMRLPRFTPDRLIEIVGIPDEKDLRWRLVLREEIGDVAYLTLSHCWGSSLPLRLTRENYSNFLQPSSCSQLPKAYQDSLGITLSLGFRYIWIDSLCIIQDDKDDWRTQSSMMWNIYKSSECNIAATWASDDNGGCFAEREPWIAKPTILALDSASRHPTMYQVEHAARYNKDVEWAPLNTRCWVVQERYLPRKQLSFAHSQVYWECPEFVASEHLPTGIPKRLLGLVETVWPDSRKPSLGSSAEMDLRHKWTRLAEYYPKCRLTYPSDKLIALSGLATEVRNATNDVYLAGVWQDDLRRQLCWIPQYIHIRSTPSVYLAPTWSWVSWDGPVRMDKRSYRDGQSNHDVDCLEVLDVSAHSEDPTGLHSFTKLDLTVQGIALWARVLPAGSSSSCGLRCWRTWD
ncbi:HET-domain-containing protein [Achaetomium macrosporum]|uniref:HET-domain-containing protein n=1 Tax=Achaetomium macrosporum TaxID=79813 RepID=A0AAN7CFF6_9PEZI|nr:HET-domain-containing protein [Achaetomium macrosporum]